MGNPLYTHSRCVLAQKASCLGCSSHHVLTGTTGVIDLISALGTSACYKANFFPGGEFILKRLNIWKICEDNSLNWIGQEEEKGRDCSLNISQCLWRLWEMSSGMLGSLRGLWCPWAHFGLSPPPPKGLRTRAWSAEGKKVMCFTQKWNPLDFLLERHGPLRKNKTSYSLLAQFNVPNIYQVPTMCRANWQRWWQVLGGSF